MIIKILITIFLFINSIMGIRFFLNVFHVLHTSKYSKTATLIYAIIFSALAISGLYFFIVKPEINIALWLGIGPWVIILSVLLFNMLTGDYK